MFLQYSADLFSTYLAATVCNIYLFVPLHLHVRLKESYPIMLEALPKDQRGQIKATPEVSTLRSIYSYNHYCVWLVAIIHTNVWFRERHRLK